MIYERFEGFYFDDENGDLVGPFATQGMALDAEEDYWDEVEEDEYYEEEDDGFGFI